MHYTIYKTTNKINGKVYIGKHATESIDDEYLGSGKLVQRGYRQIRRRERGAACVRHRGGNGREGEGNRHGGFRVEAGQLLPEGKVWITDGEKSRMVDPPETLAPGWHYGRPADWYHGRKAKAPEGASRSAVETSGGCLGGAREIRTPVPRLQGGRSPD